MQTAVSVAVGERRGQVVNTSVGCGCISVTKCPKGRFEDRSEVAGEGTGRMEGD